MFLKFSLLAEEKENRNYGLMESVLWITEGILPPFCDPNDKRKVSNLTLR